MKTLAIIPARGGSKRLPNKNILKLGDKPLICWTIQAALDCNIIDTVMVTTDSQQIAEIAISAGAEVPFIRKSDLATDKSSSVDVVLDVVDFYKRKNIEFDSIILLQPTSPLRNSSDIENALKLFEKKNASSVVSVCECDHSPLWCNTLNFDLSMDEFIPEEIKNIRSQDLEKYYRINGAIYIVDNSVLVEEKKIFTKNSFAFIMNKERSVDIDTEIDFRLAREMLNS